MFRILRAISTPDLAQRLDRLRMSEDAGSVTATAIAQLHELFGRRDGKGIELAIQATTRLVDPEEVALSSIALTVDLIAAI